MGWTHNWRRLKMLDPVRFAAASDDCHRLASALPIDLAGIDGSNDPIFGRSQIAFNGPTGEACEPFDIGLKQHDDRGRETPWSFCKTQRLPYDRMVQAALIVLKHHLGDAIIVGSDGSDDDWDAARSLVFEHLGYGLDFRLDGHDE